MNKNAINQKYLLLINDFTFVNLNSKHKKKGVYTWDLSFTKLNSKYTKNNIKKTLVTWDFTFVNLKSRHTKTYPDMVITMVILMTNFICHLLFHFIDQIFLLHNVLI